MSHQPPFFLSYISASLLLGALCLLPFGCASSAAADRNSVNDSSADQRVTGQPPSEDEDRARQLPDGPDILTGAQPDDKASQGPESQGASDSNIEESVEASIEEKRATVSRESLQALLLKGPSFPLAMVEVDPAREGSEFVGYRVLAIAKPAEPTLQGHLQTGDIITHLNGVRVKKPDDYLNAWKRLADIEQVRIDYLRDSEQKHAVWHVK